MFVFIPRASAVALGILKQVPHGTLGASFPVLGRGTPPSSSCRLRIGRALGEHGVVVATKILDCMFMVVP